MPIDTDPWENNQLEYDRQTALESLRNTKFATMDKTFSDMLTAAISLGFTGAQARAAIEKLFRDYISSWMAYLFIGEESIVTDIQNDTGLGFLNAEYPPGSGVTVRDRLINRLTQ